MSLVRGIRASESEWERWQAAADGTDKTLNRWVAQSLNESAALDEALARANLAIEGEQQND